MSLPDGYSIKREPSHSGVIVKFNIYKHGYVWPSGQDRPYHTVELFYLDDGVPNVSLSSGSDKSVELAVCVHAALGMAIEEALHS